MFVYEGVNSLKNHLAISDERALGEFPLPQYCSRLIEILAQPMLMDIQGDIKCKCFFTEESRNGRLVSFADSEANGLLF